MGHAASSSRFGAKSTAEEVVKDVDLHGKNIIVTGSNTGIGLETARVLAKQGAHVIMACRDVNKASTAASGFIEQAPGGVEVLELDLSSLASVRKFVEEFNAQNIPLHVLINNAGVMACPYMKTKDGFENQLGTNHLGHFLLTTLLIPRLKEGAPSRVINVSSLAHKYSGIKFDDLQSEKSYDQWKVYGQSKSANILFAIELTKRYSNEGIYANALHPGVIISTDLLRHQSATKIPGFYTLSKPLEWIGWLKTIPQGAATQVYVATAPELEGVGGRYFSDCNFATPRPHATNEEDAARLWEVSKELVGLEL